MQFEQVLRHIAEVTRDGVVIVDARADQADGPRILWCNEAACTLARRAREEIIGSTLHLFEGPDADRSIAEAVAEATRIAHEVRSEIQTCSETGDPIWIELDARPLSDASGAVGQIVLFLRDITQKRVLEAKLERVRGLADSVPGALFQAYIGDDGSFLHPHLSAGVESLFGVSLADIRADNTTILRGMDPSDLKVWRRQTKPLLATGGTFDLTYRYMHPRRGVIHVRTVARAERVEGGVIWNAYCSDVTEAAKREADLRAAKEDSERLRQRLQLAASAGKIGFWVYDASDDRLEWDDGMLALYGIPRTEFQGHVLDWSERVHPDDRDAANQSVQAALDGHADFDARFRVLRPDGTVVHIVGRAARDRTRPDHAVLVGVNWEATEFVEARERAEAGAQAKGTFLANMSHEIRTPLNGVIGLAGILEKTPLNDRQREMVKLIGSSGETLQALLNDILDMSRIEAGKLDIEVKPINVAQEVRAAAFPLAAGAAEKGVAFDVAIDSAADGMFMADPVRVRQIVANLASNAVKFTREGTVSIELKHGWSDLVGAEAVSIRVTDTGIGFDEAVRTRLFDRFEQADGSITRSYGGSGLGLAIVKSLVDLMRGAIEVESTPGKGSVFTVHLPVERIEGQIADDASAYSAMKDTIADRPNACRILVAEDNPTNQRVISLILESIGAETHIVANGALAAEACESATFDLILMDMQMPVIDGLTATRRIRTMEHSLGRPRTPVLMLTANAMEDHILQAMAAGADLHIPKPITPAVLINKISEVVQAQEPREVRAAV